MLIQAQEEKARHQKQYPEYRYQPKRGGRGSLSTTSSTDSEASKCPKCGGCSMTASRLPSPVAPETPEPVRAQATTRIPTPLPLPIPAPGPPARAPRPSPPYSASSVQGGFSQYPTSPSPSPFSNRAVYVSGHGSLPYNTPVSSASISPELKRRRINSATELGYGPAQHGSAANGAAASANASASLTHRPLLAALPRAELLPRSGSVTTRKGLGSATSQALTLAPIKVGSPLVAQAKSVEAMIMSIAPLGKVRTLSKISAPLGMPGSASPPHAMRGCVIAVEGTDDETLKTLITHLRTRLHQGGEHVVKLFHGGNFAARGGAPSFGEWLKVIQSWHNSVQDIKDFVSSVPAASPSITPPTSSIEPMNKPHTLSSLTAKSVNDQADPNRVSSTGADDDKDRPMDGAAASGEAQARKRKATELEDASVPTKHPIPVAVIPRYQLTLTDMAASVVPISDGYSPVDHWQWMAATWRGIPGPDITILVKPYMEEGEGSQSSGSDGKARSPDVEVRLLDYRTVIVRYEKGGTIAESSLRRVVFEVEEWVRGMEDKGWRSG